MVTMVKTTVYLPEETKQRLAEAARRSGEPEARIIRSAIEGWLETLLPRAAPHWGTIEFADSRLPYRVDEVLAEGFGQS